jgi:outer membrane immunogenic protein
MNGVTSSVIGTLAICVSVGASAAPSNPFYIGGKWALLDSDVAGLDDSSNLALVVGYDFMSTPNGAFGVEGEISTSISEGDIDGGGEWEADTWALYGTYRTEGPFYAKARLGYLHEDIKVSGAGVAASGDDSGVAYGLGVGWEFKRGSSLELEYTAGSEDINMTSLAYIVRF